MTDEPNDDDMEYRVGDLQAGIYELMKWADAGCDIVISIDGKLVGRIIPYAEQPAAPNRPTVTVRLPRAPEE